MRWTMLWSVAALLTIAASFVSTGSLAAATSPASACHGKSCTITFSIPGVGQTWVVPPGVTSASFTLYGAIGGSENTALGGDGAKVTGTLQLSAGTSVTVDVGGAGSPCGCDPPGVNGGGQGGDAGDGGGGSDIRIGGVDQLVAGGGGGSGLDGENCTGGNPLTLGGIGGNADSDGGAGQSMTDGTATFGGGGGGGAGEDLVTSNGGTPGLITGIVPSKYCGGGTPNEGLPGIAGVSGSDNQGGGGGPSPLVTNNASGGGGGGGFVGGGQGGGGAVESLPTSDYGGGGGGGGSSFGVPGSGFTVSDTANVSSFTSIGSVNGGNGEVIIGYVVGAITTTTTSSIPTTTVSSATANSSKFANQPAGLAVTGIDIFSVIFAGGVLIVGGTLLLGASLSRRRKRVTWG